MMDPDFSSADLIELGRVFASLIGEHRKETTSDGTRVYRGHQMVALLRLHGFVLDRVKESTA